MVEAAPDSARHGLPGITSQPAQPRVANKERRVSGGNQGAQPSSARVERRVSGGSQPAKSSSARDERRVSASSENMGIPSQYFERPHRNSIMKTSAAAQEQQSMLALAAYKTPELLKSESQGADPDPDPVLQLSVGVPAWGVKKLLRLNLTPASFRRVHQRIERFAVEAVEREGAVAIDRPNADELATLEAACANEFAAIDRRLEAARELERSRRQTLSIEDDADYEVQRHGAGLAPDVLMPAWDEEPVEPQVEAQPSTEDANAPSSLEQLRAKAEQLRARLRDAEASLKQVDDRREAAESRLAERARSDRTRDVATQTEVDPA